MSNHLASESSPYLLGHAQNPVQWYPWAAEPLELAKQLDRPIFVSIGYNACHWCHVMEHESFEDAEIAAYMNDHFVNIKVDREERPDLDQIYMSAVQMMTGRGGWPMSVFLTPDQEPFYGGTYWPARAKMGMPGFDQILAAVHDAWTNRREQALEQSSQIAQQIRAATTLADQSGDLTLDSLRTAVAALERDFDHRNGGFGGAPKFPHPMDLRVLLRVWRRDPREGVLKMVCQTLDRMAAGGLYDHLGGGFHRYSVDERWLVPHFEKMLYDNALLVPCYLEAFQITGDANYARVARETLDYVLRDMTDPAGGFYSTEDADSEGVEGKFYVWSAEEVAARLPMGAAKTFSYVYDVSDAGNFEGQNILNFPKTIAQCAAILKCDPAELEAELAESRRQLLAARGQRIRPARDDKVLVSWNGMMIDALAMGAGVLAEPKYLAAANRAAEFLLKSLCRNDGRLWHTWRGGEAKLDAYLDDYACLANGLVTLYEVGFEERWIDAAVDLADRLVHWFHDPEHGGFFFTASDHEHLIARPKDVIDSSVPSGSAMAATALWRLGRLCGRSDYLEIADGAVRSFAGLAERSPMAAGQLLLATDAMLDDSPELVILGSADQENNTAVLSDVQQRYLPTKVVAFRAASKAETRGAETQGIVAADPSSRPVGDSKSKSPALSDIFAGKPYDSAEPTLYVCQRFACAEPVAGTKAIRQALDDLPGQQQAPA